MILAQHWLYGKRRETEYDAWVAQHLALPNTLYTATRSITAERIVFQEDVPSLLYELADNDQISFSGMLKTAFLPYDCFWLEYKSRFEYAETRLEEVMHIGGLVVKQPDSSVLIALIGGSEFNNEFASAISHVIRFRQWPPIIKDGASHAEALTFSTVWSYNDELSEKRKRPEHEYTIECGQFLLELIFGIFLITQPKVYTVEEVTHASRLQTSRRRSGKAPLLEYRRIRLRILCGSKRYSSNDRSRITSEQINRTAQLDDDANTVRRRYHKVMGHFRHYINGNNPHTKWIAPHYRGDPALGVTFTERDVTI